MSKLEIDGVVPIIPTPFGNDGGVDWGDLERLLDFAVQSEVCAVCLPAYASEFYKLTEQERRDLALRAIDTMKGRLPVIAQVNHVSARFVAETARELEGAGAAAISVAVPRTFALPERDLLRYFDAILSSISIPVVIQDFNPGGATVSLNFIKSLHTHHDHFRYLKLEEPLMAAKVRAIREETDGAIGVIDGWGGTYMLELIEAGICGVMPALGVSDLLQIIWNHARAGRKDEAYGLFQGVLPQISYSLQSLEFFHHAEKALLAARGVLTHTSVRDATLTIDDIDREHIDFLNGKIVRLAEAEKAQVKCQEGQFDPEACMSESAGLVLTGGTIVDGTGAPARVGDVVLRGERILSVDSPGTPWTQPYKVVDCAGCVIAPGFIDAHSHSDLKVLENRTEKLLQGVTTEVVGNCGFSPYPAPEDPSVLREFANGILNGNQHWAWNSALDYLASARQSKTATVASLVGHGSLRIRVAGNTSRALTQSELDTMCGLLGDAMEQGAAGLSSGLMYAPGSGADSQELIALCRVVARKGGVYATHMRSYSAGLVEAVQEQVAIAERSGCRLQISHLQAAGEEYWPLQQRAIALIEEASARGIDLAFDAYPWLAGSTVLTQVLPQAALDGGIPKLLSRLRDPLQRDIIGPQIKPEAHWSGVVITAAANDEASLVGRSIEEIADERGSDPATTVMDLLLEQDADVTIVEHCQSLENLHALMTHPRATIITDGVYTKGRSHPRLYATFPLLLGELVRERKWLTLEEAIHKVTDKPATAFHLRDRGRIEAGYMADITVFDPVVIRTEATYEKPDVVPSGIRAVLRNGNMIVDSGVARV